MSYVADIPEQKEVAVAEAVTAPALPSTASELPLIGLPGLLSVTFGLVLKSVVR
jgi:hypothetical protein